jgi:hypothetical protein
MSEKPISPLRRRMLEDMTVRRLGEKTKSNYIYHIEKFTAFLGHSPDTELLALGHPSRDACRPLDEVSTPYRRAAEKAVVGVHLGRRERSQVASWKMIPTVCPCPAIEVW